MTRMYFESASTVPLMYSHRPCSGGMNTSGVPDPLSTIVTRPRGFDVIGSVPQWFAGLERVLNAIERFALAAQLQKRLTLQIQQILLAHGGLMGERSARENRRERASDQRVVVADASGAPRQMNTQLQSCEHAAPPRRDPGAMRRRRVALACALERERFGVGEEPIAVHRNRVRVPQVAETQGVGCARRDLAEPDGLERALHERQQVGLRDRRLLDAPCEHLLRPAAGGN